MGTASRGTRGFALAEAMIVIAILGLLAAVAIPQFASERDRGAVDGTQRCLAQLRTAIDKYWAQHDGFPGPTAEALCRQLGNRTDRAGRTGSDASCELGPYLPDGLLPENPVTGRTDARVVDAMPEKADGLAGWIYCHVTGELRSDAPGRTADGVAWFDL